MSIYIYGAGFNCEACINALTPIDNIAGILDQNAEKWGEQISGLPILSPNVVENRKCDRIVISIADYVSAVEWLFDKGIETEKICVFNSKNKAVVPLKDVYVHYVEERLFRKDAIRQIKTGLFLEAWQKREFDNIKLVSVFGEKDDYELIKELFDEIGNKVKVVYREILSDEGTCKYILSGADYKNVLIEIRDGRVNSQWLILPFFDVKDSLDWK